MPHVTPFRGIRPRKDLAARVAALPYDVYNRKEAGAIIAKEPLSFLRIDRAETGFPEDVSPYDDRVYRRAKELLEEMISDGTFITENNECYYIYELTRGDHSQTGLAACSAIADYQRNIIKKHENTHPEKELDRIRHVETTNAHTGPIFMVYRAQEKINRIIAAAKITVTPEYDFISADDVRHRVWVIDSSATIKQLREAFLSVPATYIADGHHRLISAVKVGLKRAENPAHTGAEEYNRFLSVLFPDDQVKILPSYRVVTDLGGLSREELIEQIKNNGFAVEYTGKAAVTPARKGCFGMCLRDGWYRLTARAKLLSADPVAGLDVAILQDHLLGPVLNINDPRIDKRIDFIGGNRGLSELEKRVAVDMAAAFSLFPTSIEELLSVADAGKLMPPKSTWFEPKLRSGLFIHALNNVPI